MATRAEHYRKAEELEQQVSDLMDAMAEKMILPEVAEKLNASIDVALRRAQVHATLASVAFPTVSETTPRASAQ